MRGFIDDIKAEWDRSTVLGKLLWVPLFLLYVVVVLILLSPFLLGVYIEYLWDSARGGQRVKRLFVKDTKDSHNSEWLAASILQDEAERTNLPMDIRTMPTEADLRESFEKTCYEAGNHATKGRYTREHEE